MVLDGGITVTTALKLGPNRVGQRDLDLVQESSDVSIDDVLA